MMTPPSLSEGSTKISPLAGLEFCCCCSPCEEKVGLGVRKKREGIVIRPIKHMAKMARGLFRRILLGIADDIAVVCVMLFGDGRGKERSERERFIVGE